MISKKPILTIFAFLAIVFIIVIVYLFMKFSFYEEQVLLKIKNYNKAVKLYYSKKESLEPEFRKEFKDGEYIYLNESESALDFLGTNYEFYIEKLDKKIGHIVSMTHKMEIKKKNKGTVTKNELDIDFDAPLSKGDTTIDKDLFYSPDEIQDVYQEAAESKKNLKKVSKKNKK